MVWNGLAYVVVELEVVWMVDELLVVEEVIKVEELSAIAEEVVKEATLLDNEAEEETEEEELDDVNVGAEVEDEAFVVVVQAIGP